MGARVKEKVFLPHLEAELKALNSMKIIIGPVAAEGSELAKYAGSNEFGAEIKPKNTRFLAVPLRPEAKERSPRDFDLVPIFPKNGTPYLARIEGEKVTPYYLLKKKIVIPERSFLRSTFDKRDTIEKVMRVLKDSLSKLLAGSMTSKGVANAVGESLASCVKENIASNIGPGNAPLTLALKNGKSTTLVDEARMLKSISYEVKG